MGIAFVLWAMRDKNGERVGYAIDALNFFNNWIMPRQRDGWPKERHDYWFKSRDWASQVVE